VSLNLEQQISSELGVFARAGIASGGVEPYEFSDIDRTLAAGLSLGGKQWGRPDDSIGIAGVVNGISSAHKAYFNAGGLGILAGDGRLPKPGRKRLPRSTTAFRSQTGAQRSIINSSPIQPTTVIAVRFQ
jgi:high affinity Mn2+ porin